MLALAALGLLAAPGAARKAAPDPLAGRVAAETRSCAPGSISGGSLTVAGASRVMTRFTARRIWVAPVTGCPALHSDDILIVDHLAGGSGYCQDDRLRALRPGGIIPGPYCRLGAFTAYDKPK